MKQNGNNMMVSKCSFGLLLLLSVVAVTGCKTTSKALKPDIQSSVVFEPKEGEYTSLRIPALVITKKNTLLAFCEARVNNANDWGDMDLAMKRSTDGGKTWGSVVAVGKRISGVPVGNPTPIVDEAGTIHLLYQQDYATAHYTKSEDDGLTWSDAVNITNVFDQFKTDYDWKVLAPGPGHGIQLQNGRLMAAVWLSNSNQLVPRRSHHPSCVATIYSDDLGKTWKRGDIVADSSEALNDPNETMAVQLKDGRVMLNMRNTTKVHRRAVSYSADGATNWSKPVFDEALFDPICMGSTIRMYEKSKSSVSRLLFVNPDSRNIEKTPRKNLTVKLSYDEGDTWSVQKLLNEGPSGYSDLAVGSDGTIYCLYETNTVGKGFNYSLILKKFNLEWLTDGKDNWKSR